MSMFKFVASSLFGAPAVTISTYVPNHHYYCRTRTKHASPDYSMLLLGKQILRTENNVLASVTVFMHDSVSHCMTIQLFMFSHYQY